MVHPRLCSSTCHPGRMQLPTQQTPDRHYRLQPSPSRRRRKNFSQNSPANHYLMNFLSCRAIGWLTSFICLFLAPSDRQRPLIDLIQSELIEASLATDRQA
ncbi:hypothetical protein E2C01_047310 [Portunus trituberculatus]|uniref:Uncharacterized protein n=1 Tax=Portunus trituberculatus TaxID=210409 RepID=A0A5B7G042_PORTR|nr:hypothetical protein [Portunus trituberculatus]